MEQRIGVDHLGRRLRTLPRRRQRPTSTPREFVAGFPTPCAAVEDRLLCARAESKWCALDPGSWSALRALTITVEDDEPAAAWSAAICSAAAGAAAARASISPPARRRRHPLRRDHARRRPRQPDRVPLREGIDRRRVAGDPDAAPASRRLRPASRSTPPFQRRPPQPPPLRHGLRRQRRLQPRLAVLRSTTTRRRTPAIWRSPAATSGAGSTTSTSPGPIPTRARRARSRAPTGGSPGRPASTPGFSSSPAATSPRSPIARCRGPALYSLHLWLRDEAGNDAPSSALEVPLRFDDVRARRSPSRRGRRAADVPDADPRRQ